MNKNLLTKVFSDTLNWSCDLWPCGQSVPRFSHASSSISVKIRYLTGELAKYDFERPNKCFVVFRVKMLTEALVVFNEVLSAPFKSKLGSLGPRN
jgi:hypothetical protein